MMIQSIAILNLPGLVNHGKTMGKPWENGKTIGKWRFTLW
jgi:hypothetical protein